MWMRKTLSLSQEKIKLEKFAERPKGWSKQTAGRAEANCPKNNLSGYSANQIFLVDALDLQIDSLLKKVMPGNAGRSDLISIFNQPMGNDKYFDFWIGLKSKRKEFLIRS